jgi:hypothetical protein
VATPGAVAACVTKLGLHPELVVERHSWYTRALAGLTLSDAAAHETFREVEVTPMTVTGPFKTGVMRSELPAVAACTSVVVELRLPA